MGHDQSYRTSYTSMTNWSNNATGQEGISTVDKVSLRWDTLGALSCMDLLQLESSPINTALSQRRAHFCTYAEGASGARERKKEKCRHLSFRTKMKGSPFRKALTKSSKLTLAFCHPARGYGIQMCWSSREVSKALIFLLHLHFAWVVLVCCNC